MNYVVQLHQTGLRKLAQCTATTMALFGKLCYVYIDSSISHSFTELLRLCDCVALKQT